MRRVIYFFGFVLLISCAGFQDASLTSDTPLLQYDSIDYVKPAPAVISINNGVFYDSKTDLSKWETSHGNLSIMKKDSAMVVNLSQVGADWEMLRLKFLPRDFTGYSTIVLYAKATSKDTCNLRLDLADDQGRYTNYVPQVQKIIPSEEYREYKFVFGPNYIQNWPVRANVDKTKVSELRVNFNGGGPNYTGRIFIREIKVIKD